MHRQKHPALLPSDHVVLNSRGQHQQMSSVKIMRLAFGRHLEMALEHLDGHDSFGPMRSQACEMTEKEQRHRRGSSFIQRLLAVPGLAGVEFLCESRGYFLQIERVLRGGEARFGMLS